MEWDNLKECGWPTSNAPAHDVSVFLKNLLWIGAILTNVTAGTPVWGTIYHGSRELGPGNSLHTGLSASSLASYSLFFILLPECSI